MNVSVVTRNCNNTSSVTNIMAIKFANCLKTVSLSFCCGTAPYSVTYANICSANTPLAPPVVFNSVSGVYTYSVPNDGQPHDYVITVRDSTGKIVGQFERKNVRCQ
jgi:hypothetical protein